MEKISNSYLLEIQGGGIKSFVKKIIFKISVAIKLTIRLVRY